MNSVMFDEALRRNRDVEREETTGRDTERDAGSSPRL